MAMRCTMTAAQEAAFLRITALPIPHCCPDIMQVQLPPVRIQLTLPSFRLIRRQHRVPFPTVFQPGQWAGKNSIKYLGDDQDTHYNALQATIEKQLTRGLQVTANYAWQRSYNWNMNFVTWDPSAVKGLDDSARQQQFVFYGLYQLPFGHNQMV